MDRHRLFHVEHFQSIKMVKILLVSLVALSSTIGCEKRLSEPERLDPVFLLITNEVKSTESVIAKEQKNLEELRKDFDKAAPLSKERTIAKRDSEKTRENIALLEQNLKYLKIRSERRKIESRMAYHLAMDRGEPWPDPQEKEHYETAHRLRRASKSWDSRVPKLADRIPGSTKPSEKKKK